MDDTDTPDDLKSRLKKIKPPEDTRTSSILNGVGNGLMLGTIPSVIYNIYTNTKMNQVPTPAKVGLAFAAVSGVVIGGFMGLAEAKRMERYRHGLSEEVAQLRAEVDANNATIESWADKYKLRKEEAEKAPTIQSL